MARGTRRRGYFAAAVAARQRSRQAIMAVFLQVPHRSGGLFRSFFLRHSFAFFSLRLLFSHSRTFSLQSTSSLFTSRNVATFQLVLSFSISLHRYRSPTLTGMRRDSGVDVTAVPHERTSTCHKYIHTRLSHTYTNLHPGGPQYSSRTRNTTNQENSFIIPTIEIQ